METEKGKCSVGQGTGLRRQEDLGIEDMLMED